jgi:hypothetical protein
MHQSLRRNRELTSRRDELARQMFLASKFPRQRAELRVQIYRLERQMAGLDREGEAK